jgi:Macrocin-O-methyltransferase (TylF)
MMSNSFDNFVAAIEAAAAAKIVSDPDGPLGHVLSDPALLDTPTCWVAEFGVFSGRTLALIRQKTPPDVPVFGFDCFTGLPQRWRNGFEAGCFNMRGSVPNILDRTTIVKGLFSESLPGIKRLVGATNELRLLHIDCDLYVGARDVFIHLESNIVSGTIIVFDELLEYPGYKDHEIKAFYEFVERTGAEFEVLAARGEQVAVRIL